MRLHIEPVKNAPSPEELAANLKDIDNVLVGGLLNGTRMDVRILEIPAEELKELLARAFGATHRFGTELCHFSGAKIWIDGVPMNWGRLHQLVELYGLAYSPC
ncbi:MAG: hypothetical protein HYR72_27020 [Deltaproteobacteria bacterium]|nr:hypothetical protein [Deltaproteobacteria bacterium]MBI3390333.1 hypothetical protein [Deltaproteobacteria bacterium]